MAMGHPTEIALDALKEAGRCIGLAAMAVTITIHVPLHEETGVSYTNTRGARRNNNSGAVTLRSNAMVLLVLSSK